MESCACHQAGWCAGADCATALQKVPRSSGCTCKANAHRRWTGRRGGCGGRTGGCPPTAATRETHSSSCGGARIPNASRWRAAAAGGGPARLSPAWRFSTAFRRPTRSPTSGSTTTGGRSRRLGSVGTSGTFPDSHQRHLLSASDRRGVMNRLVGNADTTRAGSSLVGAALGEGYGRQVDSIVLRGGHVLIDTVLDPRRVVDGSAHLGRHA